MQLIGLDIGSSAIKGCLLDVESGTEITAAQSPASELPIKAPEAGWAEQDPEVWWDHSKKVIRKLLDHEKARPESLSAIGIAYQMHGLVVVDEHLQVLRPAIIWCDGRAVEIGENAYRNLGPDYCLNHYLNSPGNFTASKLRWVKENEPEIFSNIYKAMLPGDFVAMKLTGDVKTSISGLSEGILWDYSTQSLALKLLEHYGIPAEILPEYQKNIGVFGEISDGTAEKLGIPAGVPVAYRAGDQPNNALSLNVLDPGEIAATAGTSGVIYGVIDQPLYDKKSRVNTFVHINHREDRPRYGVLLCINGTGIQYSWLKNELLTQQLTYDAMNRLASEIAIGSQQLQVFPFGNGPERVLENRKLGAQIRNLDFNRHGKSHLVRAAQEGIAFSLNYGFQVMKEMGLSVDTIRVGNQNMFKSPVFCEAFTNVTGTTVEVFDSSGALGAAIGAGMGINLFNSRKEAFGNLRKVKTLIPDKSLKSRYADIYGQWQETLQREIQNN